MKKFTAMLLVTALAVSLFAGCGAGGADATEAPTEPPKPQLEGTLEELLNQIVEKQPVEFMGGTRPVDVTDTSEDGLTNVKATTGLDGVDGISEAAAFEPMIGSIAFSMVMVRVSEGVDARAVADEMKNGIDTRKWICVEADDLMVAGYGDVVMLIMVDSANGLSAQSYVDAFRSVCGAELDFVLE